jgi:hypothetical protein
LFFVQSVKLVQGREAPLVRLSKMTPTQKREIQMWKIRRDLDAEQLRDARELPHQHGSAFRLSDLNDKELTFQPAVNPLSVQMAEVRNATTGMKSFSDRLYNESKTWRKKSVEHLKEKINKEEMKECTFTPNIKKSKKTFQTSLGYDVETTQRTDTPDRLSRWQEQRDRKIAKLQHEKAAKVYEDCTFHPNVDSSSKSLAARKVPAGTGGPANTRKRSQVQQNISQDRQRRASAVFYARQKRAQDSASELRKALSPHKPLHMHPDLNSKTSAHVIANEEIGDSKNIGSPVDQHLNRMVKARANREMRRNSTLRNQLRNPWSVNGNTNPDLISINADSSTIPKDHVNRGSNKARKGFKQRSLRPPVVPGDMNNFLPNRIPTSERVSPKSVPLPRY